MSSEMQELGPLKWKWGEVCGKQVDVKKGYTLTPPSTNRPLERINLLSLVRFLFLILLSCSLHPPNPPVAQEVTSYSKRKAFTALFWPSQAESQPPCTSVCAAKLVVCARIMCLIIMFNSTLWLRDAAEVVLPWTDEAGGF